MHKSKYLILFFILGILSFTMFVPEMAVAENSPEKLSPSHVSYSINISPQNKRVTQSEDVYFAASGSMLNLAGTQLKWSLGNHNITELDKGKKVRVYTAKMKPGRYQLNLTGTYDPSKAGRRSSLKPLTPFKQTKITKTATATLIVMPRRFKPLDPKKGTIVPPVALKASISSNQSQNKVTKGESVTFKARINTSKATLIWKLDGKTVSEKSLAFHVNTRDLSAGMHTVTLEAYLNQGGLGTQKKVVSKKLIVLSGPTPKATYQNDAKATVIRPKLIPPTVSPASAPLLLPKSTEVFADRPSLPANDTKADTTHSPDNGSAVAEEHERRLKLLEQERRLKLLVNTKRSVELEEPPEANDEDGAREELSKSKDSEKELQLTESNKKDTRSEKSDGEILYNPPAQMTLNKTERVEVRIGWGSVSNEELIGTGEIKIEKIPVSTYMTVKLCCGEPGKGHSFDIVPLNTDPKQIIDKTGYTQWAFDITPRNKGQQKLNLSVSAHYTYPNGEVRTKDTPVITRVITVKVNAASETKSWFIQNWKWIGGFIIIPILLAYIVSGLNRRKKRRKFSGKFNIFISYRRKDSSGYSLALNERLNQAFGDENVFMDLDDIPHGSDFVEHIEKVLSKAHVLLVMISENWINASNDKGRRLDDPDDFVRLEVATALKRNIRVIPVLLKNAKMPSEEELPDVLKIFSRRNAIKIHDDQFEASIEKLINAIVEEKSD